MIEVRRRIIRSIPKDFFLGVNDAMGAGFATAYQQCQWYSEGHRRNAIGQARHFSCNQALATVFAAHGFAHTGLQGAYPVVGELNGIVCSRIHLPYGEFERARKGKTRLEIASHNAWVTALVQPDLFEHTPDQTRMGMFIATEPHLQWDLAAEPRHIFVIVTDHKFDQAVWRASLQSVISMYDAPAEQQDHAQVTLKQVRKRQDGPSDV